VSRREKGGKNREKARRKGAKIHARITDRRNDYAAGHSRLHQLTTRLVRENQTIAVETLRVQNMLKNHCLAQSSARDGRIADVSWSELVRQLEYNRRERR
jgi:putative transposase